MTCNLFIFCYSSLGETVKGGMRNGMEYGMEHGMEYGMEWGKVEKYDKSMLWYSVDIASGLLIPDVTQNSPKKWVSAYLLDWTYLINNSYTMY